MPPGRGRDEADNAGIDTVPAVTTASAASERPFGNVSTIDILTSAEHAFFHGYFDDFARKNCPYNDAPPAPYRAGRWSRWPAQGMRARTVRITLVRRTPGGRHLRWTGARWRPSSRSTRASVVTRRANWGSRLPERLKPGSYRLTPGWPAAGTPSGSAWPADPDGTLAVRAAPGRRPRPGSPWRGLEPSRPAA